MMTIVILFQQSHYRTFKAYYIEYVQRHLHSEFPALVSYQRFVELMPTLPIRTLGVVGLVLLLIGTGLQALPPLIDLINLIQKGK